MEPVVLARVLDRDGCARLVDVAREARAGRNACSDRSLGPRAGCGVDDELVVLDGPDRAGLGREQPRRLRHHLLEHGGRIELRREDAAGPGELL